MSEIDVQFLESLEEWHLVLLALDLGHLVDPGDSIDDVEYKLLQNSSETGNYDGLIAFWICIDSDNDSDNDIKGPPIKRTRLVKERKDPLKSEWAKYMSYGDWSDPGSDEGKLFRRRFRIPGDMFQYLVSSMRAKSLFKESVDAIGRPSAPLELKILGVLRVLGRGVCFDDIFELTNISQEVHRKFFIHFVEVFSNNYFEEYCKPPTTIAEIKDCMYEYEKAGFPGCLGSIDCVHIEWDNCPSQRRNLFTGKEKYPKFFQKAVLRPDQEAVSNPQSL